MENKTIKELMDEWNAEEKKHIFVQILERNNTEMKAGRIAEIESKLLNRETRSPSNTSTTLKRLLKTGEIIKIKQGLYSIKKEEKTPKVPAIKNDFKNERHIFVKILEQNNRVMKADEIAETESRVFGRPKRSTIVTANTLSRLTKDGRIKRIGFGIYAPKDFIYEETKTEFLLDEIRKTRITEQHLYEKIIEENEQPLSSKELIDKEAAITGKPQRNPSYAAMILKRLSDTGKIKRIARGVYAKSDYPQDYVVTPRSTVDDLVNLLKEQQRPLNKEKIMRFLPGINFYTVTKKAIEEGKIKKTRGKSFMLPNWYNEDDRNYNIIYHVDNGWRWIHLYNCVVDAENVLIKDYRPKEGCPADN